MYPKSLKTTKIIPIPKSGKTKTTSEGWRPVNVVAALSKIIERVMLAQIMQHLKDNDLIAPQHHGSVKGKSTQTLVTELHDLLMEDLETGQESVLLVLDQSKAYYCVSHEILLDKLTMIGFQPQAAEIMSSFLSSRKQFVQIEGKISEKLDIGPNSVIQGLTLSCILFLIYILDMPVIFHSKSHKPEEYRKCSEVNIKTFVDDSYVKAKKKTTRHLKRQ